MKSISIFALFLCCVAAIAGCSSKIVVRDISGRPPDVGKIIDGIPIQFAGREQLTVFTKQPDGSYKQVHSQICAMPDQSRLFAVRIDSEAFTNNTLTLALNDDGTPKTVGFTNTSQGQAILTQLGTSAAAMATSAVTFDQQRQAAEQKALQQQIDLQAVLKKQVEQEAPIADRQAKFHAYREALEAVYVQQAKIDGLPADTKLEDRIAEESSLRLLKLKANQAARALNQKAPYPAADLPF